MFQGNSSGDTGSGGHGSLDLSGVTPDVLRAFLAAVATGRSGTADDLDEDGKIDIWLGGNFYAVKPQVGRFNASKGVFLKGNGTRKFTNNPASECGIKVEGEVRDASVIHVNGMKSLIVARNNAKVLLFQKRRK